MYKLGHRPHQKQKLYALLILVVAGLVILAIWLFGKYFQSDTTLGPSQGINRHVDVAKPATKKVDNQIFFMSVPKSWQVVKSTNIPKAQYAWQGTTADDTARSLEIYVDTMPTGFVVNRLLPLKASDNRILTIDDVSDNCVNFTDIKKVNRQTGKLLAKWSGVDFYCDFANKGREVVGTGTPEAVNSITLDGQTAGSHRFFFVYTDHTAKQDFTVLTDLLSTFRVH